VSSTKPWYVQELIARRLELELSQRELATRMKTTQGWLSEYESGKISIKVGLLAWWAECLGWQVELSFVSKPLSNNPTDLSTNDLNDSLTHPLTGLTEH